MCRILIFKDNWTSGDVPGHAADVWASKSHEFLFCSAATAMILPITDDLVLRINAWGVTVDSFLAFGSMPFAENAVHRSRRTSSLGETRIPRARVGLRELDGSGPQGQRECGFAPQPAG
jgi:hypothetical protein